MQPDASSPHAAAAVAALVPRLLDLHPEPADTACEVALADTIERAAEHLLRWSDALVDVTPPAPAPGAQRSSPPPDDQELSLAVRAGELPGSIPSIEWASRELRCISSALRDLLIQLRPDDSAVETGRWIIRELDRLAAALGAHADSMRKLSFDLTHVAQGAVSGDDVKSRRDQVLARATRAEHALTRVAVATLPG